MATTGGIVAAAVFAVLILLILLALFIFMIRKHTHRSSRPKHDYQTLSDDSQYAAPLDLRHSRDAANVSFVMSAQANRSEVATAISVSSQTNPNRSTTSELKPSSPPRLIREHAMIRAALRASPSSVSNNPIEAGPSRFKVSDRLVCAGSASTTKVADKTGHRYGRLNTDVKDLLKPYKRHGKFEWECEQTPSVVLRERTTDQRQAASTLEGDLTQRSRRVMSRGDLPSQRHRLARYSTIVDQQDADLGLSIPDATTFDVC